MIIDNFDIFRKHLSFETKFDRYIIHVLRRTKDVKDLEDDLGSKECQRLLRTYYIDSLEYFDRKIPSIKELCKSNRARAYIVPQVRNNEECLLNLAEKILETIRLKNYSVKPEHLLRSAYCEFHKSRNKVWILDLDKDEMFGWTVEQVFELVQTLLKEIGKSENDAYLVPTKSGTHIITSPFNLQKAYEICPMLFEGVHKMKIGEEDMGSGETRDIYKNVTGWLHKDGMSLLYLNLE